MARKPRPGRPQGADLELTLDALDLAIELLETVWLQDPHNTRADRRDIKQSAARMRELAGRLIVHAPRHPIAYSLPPAHQITMGGSGSGRSGRAR